MFRTLSRRSPLASSTAPVARRTPAATLASTLVAIAVQASIGGGLVVGSAAHAADCDMTDVSGKINFLGNEFPAIQAIVAAAESCAHDGLTVDSNLTAEHKDIQVAALTANPSEYTGAFVANGSLVPLMNADLVRPLNDLVEKYGENISDRQKIVIDGNVVAIAFMANAQHLMFRKDMLEEAGVEAPTSYEEVIAASQAIKDKGLSEYPFTGTFGSGWNLGEEFINMYMGYGGQLFKDGTAEANLDSEEAVKTLEMMKSLSEFMNPDYLTFDTNAAQAEFEQGKAAMVNLWGSRAGAVIDEEGAAEGVIENVVFASAPAVGGGTTPATTLWWDGFVIPRNVSDADAEATFQSLAQGLTAELANEHADAAVWLIDGYEPTAAAQGVLASAQGGAMPYPMLPYVGLMHTALGDNLVDFLQGSEDAEKALSDAAAAYTTAAQEGGYL